MPINRDQSKVAEIIGNLALKMLLGLSAIAAFFWIIYEMTIAPDLPTKALYAGFDGLGGVCIYQVFKHYFPAKSS